MQKTLFQSQISTSEEEAVPLTVCRKKGNEVSRASHEPITPEWAGRIAQDNQSTIDMF